MWRHPNLRMAYVAQHAFHHLEEHLDTTPLKYMFKRFGLGQDQVSRDCTTGWVECGVQTGFTGCMVIMMVWLGEGAACQLCCFCWALSKHCSQWRASELTILLRPSPPPPRSTGGQPQG